MQVEVLEVDETNEVWVTVLSDRVVDWPEVKASLDQKQLDAVRRWGGTPAAYYPGDAEGAAYEDIWVFRKRVEP